MWLINVETRQLEEFIGLEVQRYAILSHTWVGGQEVTFQEMRSCDGQSPPPTALGRKSGWQKIDWTCRLAERDGLGYAWVDTCCIDKSSSAELSEAINSMFRWYERATVCYAYLADLAPAAPPEQLVEALEASIRHCRWFTRSWTLQELIAPRHIEFYDRDWRFCFTKATASAALARITGVGVDILEHRRHLSAVSVAQKMSWAASRRSTRIEDVAYSLLGIFGINMPMLYGEEGRAFRRLQTEIISSCPDYTILAWVLPNRGSEVTSTDTIPRCSGVLASSPMFFRYSGEAPTLLDQSTSFEFSMANRGIKLRAQFGLSESGGLKGPSLVLPVCRIKHETYGILVRNVGKGCFVRQNAHILVRIEPWEMVNRLMLDPYLLTKLPTPRSVSTEPRNLILESRQRVLEVVLPPSMELYRRWPWQQWDEPDTLFFGEEAPGEDLGWAALKIVASEPHPFGDMKATNCSFDFLFYIFGWTRGPGLESAPKPRCTIHPVHGAVNDRALEQMNEEAVRDGWNAYWVANRLVNNSIPEKSVLVAGNFGQSTLLVTCTLQRVEDKTTCERPFWRVVFDWEVVPRDEIPPVVDRGWKGIHWGKPGWRRGIMHFKGHNEQCDIDNVLNTVYRLERGESVVGSAIPNHDRT